MTDRRDMQPSDRRDPLNASLRISIRREVKRARRGRVRLALAGYVLLASFLGGGLVRLDNVVRAQHQDRVQQCRDANARWHRLGDGLERVIGETRDPIAVRKALGPVIDAARPINCLNP